MRAPEMVRARPAGDVGIQDDERRVFRGDLRQRLAERFAQRLAARPDERRDEARRQP